MTVQPRFEAVPATGPEQSFRDLDYVNELFEAGKFKPVIDEPFKLSEVPDALRHFGNGEHKGKVVITIA